LSAATPSLLAESGSIVLAIARPMFRLKAEPSAHFDLHLTGDAAGTGARGARSACDRSLAGHRIPPLYAPEGLKTSHFTGKRLNPGSKAWRNGIGRYGPWPLDWDLS
jgi:hypothetical protein